jgi:cysteine desulfurase family protein
MIYLNNGATSYPKPQEIINSVVNYMNSLPLNPYRSGFNGKDDHVITSCRKKLCSLFNVKEPENIIFTSGGTESLNLAIMGLNLRNSHVITTVIEHNSVLRPLKHLEKEGFITLSPVNCNRDGSIDPSHIEKEIRENTRVIIVNHCSNVTGEILDLKSISEIAHKKDIIFIVDASQSAGHIPVDVTAWNIDILAFTGHKALYGLPGTGGLYIKNSIRLRPLKFGGTGIKSELLYQPEELPLYYESGTQNLPGIVSLNAGLDFIFKTGINEIKKKEEALMENLVSELEKIPQVIIYGNSNRINRGPILSFNIKNMEPEDTGYILEKSFGIIVRAGLHCAPLIHKALGSYPRGSIRVSPSYFTDFHDIDYFIHTIKEIVKVM